MEHASGTGLSAAREVGTSKGGMSLASPDDQRVTFVELFFDLVFVFSVTQVVALLESGMNGASLLQTILAFWLVWWAWTQFTWALNAANTEHPRVQLATLVATAIAFLMAVGVPDAFLARPLWFAGPYVAVRIVGLLIYGWVAAVNQAQHAAVRLFSLASSGGLVAVLAGAAIGGPAQYWLWALAILLDIVAALFGASSESWDLHAAHFVERHGLIIIIALGEGLVVAAAGLAGAEKTPELIAVAVLSIAIACGFWWSYFPYIKPGLEEALHAAHGARQSMMARDAFSLAHFPMLLGIIAFAAAVEEAIAHPAEALPREARIALAAGVVLFLAGTALAEWRALGALRAGRLLIVAVTGASLVRWTLPPAWGSLLLALVGVVAVVVIEQSGIMKPRSPGA